jgi:hypothetical protein
MTNYQVVRIAAKTGEPSYSSTDEHALDAMMLALLAFIIEMPELAATIHQVVVARNMAKVKVGHYDPLSEIRMNDSQGHNTTAKDWDEPGPRPLKKVPLGFDKKKRTQESITWGSRGSNKNSGFERRSW